MPSKKSSRKAGTGFEPYHADPPMTPEEFQHERGVVYHPSIPFAERIEECIQRWRARRRLDSRRANIFTKYLMVGGIESGPRQFTGVDRETLEEEGLDKDEMRRAAATDVVNSGDNAVFYTPACGDGWEVDFAGVAAGFFSCQLLELSAYNEEYTLQGVGVVENFLNYVLHHDVCPEYEADVKAAREVCRRAREEILDIPHIRAALPGRFNEAGLGFCHPDGPDEETAGLVVSTVLTWGDAELVASLPADGKAWKLLASKHRLLEIVEVHRAAETGNLRPGDDRYNPNNPIGRLVVRDTFIEGGFSTTLTEEEWKAANPPVETFPLWLDDHALEGLRVGQKMEAMVAETDGAKLLGKVFDVYPTYYVFLPQNLMLGWKRPAEHPRQAPTVDTATNWLAEV